MGFELRPVSSADEAYLLELYASTREAELSVAPWTPQQKQEFVRMQFDAQRRDYSHRFPDATHSIVVFEGHDVGRVWIDRRPDETRLLDITIHPSQQNRGIGSTVMQWLQLEAGQTPTALRHSVYTTNEAALRFYHEHGFTVVEDFGAYVLMEWCPESLRGE
ncbi:MAG: GNAT family N-acetyltransferase [bacterium]|nr:GNAT family N-acetyltransferase [bacterium]